jgi:hypothetical protein
MGTDGIEKRLEKLEGHGGRFNEFGLPRDPDEARELLERVRRERLRRINENPAAFRDELARLLVELPVAKREVIAQAFSEASLARASDGRVDDGDRIR